VIENHIYVEVANGHISPIHNNVDTGKPY